MRLDDERQEDFFFSVLRLCGSRQVVAQCCADERIIQMHIQCPSLGSQKWSADLYTVRSLVRPTKKQETHKQSKTTKQSPNKKPSEKSTDNTTPMGLAACVPMNYEILQNKRTPPDHTARSCEDVQ